MRLKGTHTHHCTKAVASSTSSFSVCLKMVSVTLWRGGGEKKRDASMCKPWARCDAMRGYLGSGSGPKRKGDLDCLLDAAEKPIRMLWFRSLHNSITTEFLARCDHLSPAEEGAGGGGKSGRERSLGTSVDSNRYVLEITSMCA